MTVRNAVEVYLLVFSAALGTEDILIADFEGKDYGGWKVEGEAFGPGPARGTLQGQMRVEGFLGKGLVNSFYKGDGTTGTLTSPPFKIERKFINFLLGGGGYKDETYIALLVDGKAVRTATGPNLQPGGSEHLGWHCWDVSDLAGKEAVLQIVDKRTGGWGHINVDHVLQSDRKREEKPAMRELAIEKRYLHFPVKNGAAKRKMKVSVASRGGDTPPTIVDEFEIELADGQPDFWVFLDMAPYKGQKATIDAGRMPEESKALDAITQADDVPDAANLYKEKHRPQFHFSSRRGWNNDPNGLVFHKGEYHLYYQHNPYGWNWGNMHWGHAVSKDLVHWTELPIAIYPFRYGDWVFSGSALVDKENTAGWKKGDEDVIVAAYTSTGRGEAIAYSLDRGRTFTDYEKNPVVKHGGRDPKLIWYAGSHLHFALGGKVPNEDVTPGHWVMAVYDEHEGKRWIAFHTSPNLRDWTFQSRTEGYFECPEIFELPVDGDKSKTRWVVYAADGAYAVGSFDGKAFTPDHPGKHRHNWGNCFYASQTFNDIPPEDGRRIQIAWGRVGHKDMPFNQMMNFPVQLTLRTTEEGVRMFAEPVREVELLHAKRHEWKGMVLKEGGHGDPPLPEGDLFHIVAEFEPGDAAEVGFRIRGTPVVYRAKGAELEAKGCKAPLKPEGGKIRLEILVDRTSAEVFANRGRIYMPVGAIPPALRQAQGAVSLPNGDDNRSLEVFSKGGAAKLLSLEVHELRSAW